MAAANSRTGLGGATTGQDERATLETTKVPELVERLQTVTRLPLDDAARARQQRGGRSGDLAAPTYGFTLIRELMSARGNTLLKLSKPVLDHDHRVGQSGSLRIGGGLHHEEPISLPRHVVPSPRTNQSRR